MLPLVPWTGLLLTKAAAESALPSAPVVADDTSVTARTGRAPQGARRFRLATARA